MGGLEPLMKPRKRHSSSYSDWGTNCCKRKFLNCLVAFFRKISVINGKIHIDAADVSFLTAGEYQPRDPASNYDEKFPIFRQIIFHSIS